MISSKSRLVVPYGLKTLLEGISRAVLKTNPSNITQFAAVYFKELTMFREGNTSLDIKDLVKQFHQVKVEKWSEGATLEKKLERIKESKGTSVVFQEPTRMEKCTDTEEDSVAGLQFINKTTQFPLDRAEYLQPEDTAEAVPGPPSKPATPKATTPPPSPSPAPVSAEFTYVPADPAQFAAQMLGNVASTHSHESDVLMVDTATSMPVFIEEEVLSSEVAEEVVAAPLGCPGEVQVVSQASVQVDVGPKPKDHKAEPSTASSVPLQNEQHPPVYDQAPKAPLQADTQVTSVLRISSMYNNAPVTEGVVCVEQMPGHIVVPVPEKEQSPPGSPKLVVYEMASGMCKKSVESVKLAEVEETTNYQPLVHVEVEAVVLLSDAHLQGQPEVPAEPLDAEDLIETGPEKFLHLEVEIVSVDLDKPGQEEPPRETEGEALPPGAAAAVHTGAAARSSSSPFPPVLEGLTEPEIEPEGEAAPEQV
ncbi:calcium-binding tyrosine phosphorylation-regulated protein isoform X1 [Fukomys damarensis]|uniref:calcium-binding tyrosine phosphorylation-regulated protein isoform X1 n=1 Tax=Fukomys damarensis TaxID=885580 RepID=UPI00145539B4|nr:calcium-binding tyrosine phosphorylation-regulated protein isoform X1 [Fukomys damarensis]XP_033613475.1 calcium-binding tyrosine phosphorylation-regulated protein isoform X1 [Fukomys damarensis]XP_033613476.1 calcium-binding tyrosine phosphorylation-regulated protein isoform X1 [Fukomys damarensis]